MSSAAHGSRAVTEQLVASSWVIASAPRSSSKTSPYRIRREDAQLGAAARHQEHVDRSLKQQGSQRIAPRAALRQSRGSRRITSHASGGQPVRSSASMPASKPASSSGLRGHGNSLDQRIAGSGTNCADCSPAIRQPTRPRRWTPASPCTSARSLPFEPLPGQRCLPVPGRRDEHLDPALAFVEQGCQSRPLDDPAAPDLRFGCGALAHVSLAGAAKPALSLPRARLR